MINGEDEKVFLEPETRELTRDMQLSRILDALLRIEVVRGVSVLVAVNRIT